MRKTFVLFSALALSVTLSSCSMFNFGANNSEQLTPFEIQQIALAKLDKKYVSIAHGITLDEFTDTLRRASIRVVENVDLSKLKYTGPDLNSVTALEALEIVLGHSVLDFKLEDEGVSIIAIEYYMVPITTRMDAQSWSELNSATSALLNKNVAGRNVNLGFALDDKTAYNIHVTAPLSVRLRVLSLIDSYIKAKSETGGAVVKQPSSVDDISESTVQIGVLTRGQ